MVRFFGLLLAVVVAGGCKRDGQTPPDMQDFFGEKKEQAKAPEQPKSEPIKEKPKEKPPEKKSEPKKPTAEELEEQADQERLKKVEKELQFLPTDDKFWVESARKSLDKDPRAKLVTSEENAFWANPKFFPAKIVRLRVMMRGEDAGGVDLVRALGIKDAKKKEAFLILFGSEKPDRLLPVSFALRQAATGGVASVQDDMKPLIRKYAQFLEDAPVKKP